LNCGTYIKVKVKILQHNKLDANKAKKLHQCFEGWNMNFMDGRQLKAQRLK